MLRHGAPQMVAADEHPEISSSDDGVAATYRYAMYGEVVQSDFRLPVRSVAGAESEPAAWWFHRAGTEASAPAWPGTTLIQRNCDCPIHLGAEVTHVTRSSHGVRFWYDRAGVCVVGPDPRRVDVYPSQDCDVLLLQQVLLGIVGTLVLTRLGQPCLHASAVVTEQGTVAFLGPSGHGKSTMAATFLRNGAALLSDDVLPLGSDDHAIWAKPGVPFMKIWDPTARESLHLVQDLPSLTTHIHKRRLDLGERFTFVEAPQRLRAIFILHRSDGEGLGSDVCTIERVGPTESLLALLGSTLSREILSPVDARLLLAVYGRLLAQTGVYRLRYRDGFGYQSAVRQRLLEYLEVA